MIVAPAPPLPIIQLQSPYRRGLDVADVQQHLESHGFNLPHYGVDGIYGPETTGATTAFQRSHLLLADGIVGPRTWAVLHDEPWANPAPELVPVAPHITGPNAIVRITPPPPPLAGGVALPLPRQYLHNGSVDSGVDYSAPGGTPLYAMGDGTIIQEGIGGFGPNAPVLHIDSGPLAGRTVYYGHSGPDLVGLGAHVVAGQQISIVGYGIVGISSGPHLEIGFWPPHGAGSEMLTLINSLVGR